MPAYIVSLQLPDTFEEEFLELIPRHRAFINRLLSEHVIESYAISADRRCGWVLLTGDDKAAVQAIVEQFPLYHLLGKVHIDELFIYDSASTRFPSISLN